MTTLSIAIKSSTGTVALSSSQLREFSKGSKGWNFNLGAVIPESKQADLSLEVKDVDTGAVVFAGMFAPKKDLSGSFGLYAGGKSTVEGLPVSVGVNLTLRNSNPNIIEKYNPSNKTSFQMTGNVVIINSAPQTVERQEAKLAAKEQSLLEQMAKLDARRAEIAALKASIGQ